MLIATPRKTTTFALLVCAFALLAGACGSGASSSSEPSEGAPVSSSTSESAAESESPLGDLLGIPFTDDDAMEEYFAGLTQQAEAKIAECMVAQGFQYRPVDYSNIQDIDNQVDFDTREFAEQYGFGIASNPFEESFEAFENFEDPNQTYLDSLSQGEQEAYQTALSGVLPDVDQASQADFEGFEPGGCQGGAYDELFSFGRVFEQFGSQFDEIEEAYNSDPRVVQATAGWNSCMNEAGFRFTDAQSAEAEIDRRYDAILKDPDAFVSDDDLLAQAEESDGDEIVIFGAQTLAPAAQAQVDDLAVEERAIATASWDCNAPLREIEEPVRLEYEQKFVADNGAAITAALNE